MAKFKIQKSATVNQYFDATNVIGGTGGLTSIAGTQIRPNVYVVGGSAGVGSILLQKGRSKFLVQDGSGNKGQCSLANLPQANLVAGQMSIAVDQAVISYANVNVYVGGSTTYAYVTYLTANVTGVKSPTVGDYLRGTGITGNVVISSISVSGAQSNANVALGQAQVVANVSNQYTVYSGGYTQRLTNKFVMDYNNFESQWSFTGPTATTARIPGA